ncbi:MAG TPA: hypothetical protein VGN11_06190, partial [Candidatus Baltobacteraceae bacterium]|nr:hypothetical protein [Candidatus Baltobacteraceae bacterium]
MTYVEWLRVRNCLRALAIVLIALVAISLVMRISFNKYITDDKEYIAHIKMQPGSTIAHSVLPNGINRTTINDPREKTVVTIDDLGYGGKHIVITEPVSASHHHTENTTVGSIQILESAQNGTSTTTIDTNSAVPFIYYMAIADLIALIVATLLGAPFARESDGHLEIALTKPVSRLHYGLGVMGVNIVAILASSVMTIVALLICQTMYEIPHFDFTGVNTDAVLMGIALPLAWYATLTAATASMKRGYGAILGFSWPVLSVIAVFGAISWGSSLLGQAAHVIFWTISRIDPLSYASMRASTHVAMGMPVHGNPNFSLRLSAEILLFIGFGVLAL